MDFLNWPVFRIGSNTIHLENILGALLVIVLGRAVYLILRKTVLARYFKRKQLDEGRQFAISQLIKYFLYVVAFLLAVEAAGIKVTVLYAAGAALLVGIGIGLQQTFNDFMSGIILLVEGSIKKGDWLMVGDMEGRVVRIGLRTSLVQTRRRIAVIVPNSKITVENVINISHSNAFIRYWVSVGVAYGSDTKLVERILVECASNHAGIRKNPKPFVRFTDFGDSSLQFELHFWSDQFQRVVDIQSNIRFEIDQRFRENGVTIPFPQRDLHLKSGFTFDQSALAEKPKKAKAADKQLREHGMRKHRQEQDQARRQAPELPPNTPHQQTPPPPQQTPPDSRPRQTPPPPQQTPPDTRPHQAPPRTPDRDPDQMG